MPRYGLTVAYDGTNFHGWQKQHPPGAEPLRTVQGVMERAVFELMRQEVNVVGASRTDAGVHARGQVAAFTAEKNFPTRRLRRALNARLPDDVLVRRCRIVGDRFSPISEAVAKGYRYRVAHSGQIGAPRPLFDRHVTTFAPYLLDVERMNTAAQHIVGTHDFASFTRAHHGRESTVRTVHSCAVTEASRFRLHIDITGDGFLYNMIRIIAGTLMEVGRGHIDPDAIPGVLDARDRAAAGPTVPPEGLCLMWILYSSPPAPPEPPKPPAPPA